MAELFALSVVGIVAAAPAENSNALSTPAAAPVITIEVDAVDAPHKVFHSHLCIPATAGPLTLYYPKWIPGEHAPTGPLADSVGLKFRVAGTEIPWRRDPVEMYAYHLLLPAGTTSLDVSMDEVTGSTDIFGAGSSATSEIAIVNWNELLLYPSGFTSDQLQYSASIKIPAGWRLGTSLQQLEHTGPTIKFVPVSLTTLVDSPVMAGRYFRALALTGPEERFPVEMDIAADSNTALQLTSAEEKHFKQLIAEMTTLFGSHHYRRYRFLLALSDHLTQSGLEHHESSDDRSSERSLIDADARADMGSLLAHEYTHSWNGKYRRPAGLATANYEISMRDDLLWVYEGLTNYLGEVLTARSGIYSPIETLDFLAKTAAEMDHRPGRTWRSLQDTNDALPVLAYAVNSWDSWRRGADYYPEGTLIWLEVDTIIRKATQDKKSIDDFCKLFFGERDTPPEVRTYTVDDVIASLQKVLPYDWKEFFSARLNGTALHAPLGGIQNAGWKLVYNERPNAIIEAQEHLRKIVDLQYSLGLLLKEDGTIRDVIVGMPAAKAGLAPGMKILGIGGRRYSVEVLGDAVKDSSGSIDVLADNDGSLNSYIVNYHGGEQYPHLERDETQPDLLKEIYSQRAATVE